MRGARERMHGADIGPVGMARDVVAPAIVVLHEHAALGERVLNRDDAPLVAGDGLGAEEEEIAGLHLEAEILAPAELCGGGAPLPLRARDDQHQIAARQVPRLLDGDRGGEVVQHAGFLAGRDHALHRAAQQADGPASGDARGRHRLHARDVRGEGRRDDHAVRLAHEALDLGGDEALGAAGAIDVHVRRIADQGVQPLPGLASPEIRVVRLAEHGRLVGLEVARMHEPPDRRVDQNRGRLGDGVGDGHESAGEGPRLYLLHRADDAHGAVVLTLLLELAARVDRGEPAAVDRRVADAPREVPDRADMVLMRMGHEDRLDPVLALGEPSHVGEDQVDAGRGVHVAEGHAQVDDDQALPVRLAVAVDIGIHAHLAGTAEGKVDQSFGCHCGLKSSLYRWITVKPCMVSPSS